LKRIYKNLANFYTPCIHDYILWERKNKFLRKCGITIGNNVAIDQDFFILKGCEENLFIDDFNAIGIGFKVWAFNKVIIGKFNMFAGNVEISNGGHDINTFEPYSNPLIIGSGCWIGHGVKIINGVKIGNNVIIGGGSVVINDIPDNAIVVGVPAKVVKYRELPDKVWHLENEYFCPKTFELIKDGKNE
jgi:acetyltransferase-like isoleucine patch superfamily enzyme